jgi:phosphoribosylformylglycinamidine cyclo-ligase
MPGFYGEDEYDMAGFAVGIVDKENIITGENIKEGDVIIGLPSSGIHSNGYSLVRKVFEGEDDVELKKELLVPTKIYAKECAAVRGLKVNGIVHITGGGFYENVPRVLPEGIAASVDMGSWPILPIFMRVQLSGGIETREMFSTFNMGVGMMMFVDPEDAPAALEKIKAEGGQAYVIGRTVAENGEKVIINE